MKKMIPGVPRTMHQPFKCVFSVCLRGFGDGFVWFIMIFLVNSWFAC